MSTKLNEYQRRALQEYYPGSEMAEENIERWRANAKTQVTGVDGILNEKVVARINSTPSAEEIQMAIVQELRDGCSQIFLSKIAGGACMNVGSSIACFCPFSQMTVWENRLQSENKEISEWAINIKDHIVNSTREFFQKKKW